MAGPDFRNLLSRPADNVKRPVPVPGGTYYGTIKSREFGESPEKKTPYVRFHLVNIRAGEDVDPAMLTEIDLAKKEMRADFYITPDSEYRLVEALESMGIDKSGRSLGEMIEDAINQDVMIDVSVKPNQKEPDGPGFNNIDKLRGIQQ